MAMKGGPLYHDFGNEDAVAPINDVRRSLPRIFELEAIDGGFRSPPEQTVGVFSRNRVFGGQTFAQFFWAAKQTAARGNLRVARLDITFLKAGKATLPIDYRVDASSGPFLRMTAAQNGRLIASAHARLGREEPFFMRSLFPAGIKKPLECAELKAAARECSLDRWLAEFGNALNFSKVYEKTELFELRPVDFDHFAALTADSRPLFCWVRLAEGLRNGRIEEPLLVPMIASDYMSGHPLLIALDQRRVHFTSGASVSHQCVFYEHEQLDPFGFFLIENSLESGIHSGVLRGNVFAEDGRCVLSFVQQNFNQFDLTAGHEPKGKL